MSRLEDLRQKWREHPENTDNWDLKRWKNEHPRFLRLGYAYMIIFGIFGALLSLSSSYSPDVFYILSLCFGLVFLLVDYYYVRTIRRLEQEEESA